MKRLIALFLCSILIISSSSLVFAAESDQTETISTERYRVAEVPELRETNADTYLLSDGSYECVVYSEDKYYKDDTGEYKEINNSIVNTDYKSATTTYKYVNADNSTKVYFSDAYPSVLLTSGDKELAFSLIGSKKVNAQVGKTGKVYSFPEFDLYSENFITYSGVYEGADLIYSVNNDCLKEYIVLSNSSAPSDYHFNIDTKDYSIKKNDIGTLDVFNSSGELIFQFGSLFAVDSAGNYTDKLEYKIVGDANGSTIVSVSIDTEFLTAPDRVFPVLIDPSIMVTGESCTYDTYISSRYTTTNYYLYNWLRTGRDEDYYVRRSYIKFDLPSGITSNNITSAYINLKYYSGSTPSVKAYRVAGNWSSSTLTWNNMPSYNTTNASANGTLYSDNWYRLYVTNIVKSWYAGTYSNYGFMLKDSTESGTSQWTTFYSSDAASPNKPELVIYYNGSGTNYTITYNGNGNTSGSAPAVQSATSGSSVTLRTNTGGLSKTGYTFYGWCTNSSGTGTIYTPGQTITMPSRNLVLYAKWVNKYNMSVYYTPGITNAEKTRMNEAINTAFDLYLKYGIQIVPSTPSSSTELNYRTTSTTCLVVNQPNIGCSDDCGDQTECENKHHRNCTYYLNKLTSSGRVLRIVDWKLCSSDGSSDGYAKTKNMVCNVNKADLSYLIIHELAHTFGLKDGYNDAEPNCEEGCIMYSRGAEDFCNYCKTLLTN